MKIIALDIGEKRIGVAVADSHIKIPVTRKTITVDDDIFKNLADTINREQVDRIVVGLPRNSAGEETAQTIFVKDFIAKFQEEQNLIQPIIYQDESLTSVLAEQLLKSRNTSYEKADIDAEAAAIILSDYLETKLESDL